MTAGNIDMEPIAPSRMSSVVLGSTTVPRKESRPATAPMLDSTSSAKPQSIQNARRRRAPRCVVRM